MKTKTYLHLSFALLGLAASAHGDILELKNGSVLNGKYVGGTAGTVRFETSAGLQVVETSQIIALTFTTPAGVAAPAPAAPAATTPAPAAATAPSSVTLPNGTMLLVRMMDSVSSKSAAGANFTTKLEYDLVVGTTVAVKAGTVIYGKVQSSTQARRARGKSTLDIRLAQMVPAGSPVPISTSGFQQAGAASIKKVAKAATVGAVIGNNTGDGDAGKGAAIGAGVSLLKKGETITIPPGALLEFTLTQPVTVPVAK